MNGNDKRKIKLKKGDLILMACVALTAAVLMVSCRIGMRPGNTVTVYVDGEEQWQSALTADADKVFYGANGYACHVVVENGMAKVESAGCPDKSCVRQGAISRSGQTIVCLPARIVLKVSGREEETPYDAVSG